MINSDINMSSKGPLSDPQSDATQIEKPTKFEVQEKYQRRKLATADLDAVETLIEVGGEENRDHLVTKVGSLSIFNRTEDNRCRDTIDDEQQIFLPKKQHQLMELSLDDLGDSVGIGTKNHEELKKIYEEKQQRAFLALLCRQEAAVRKI